MLPEISTEELSNCLDRVVTRLLRRCAIRKPPVDALRIAAAMGIETAIDRDQQARARYVELAARRGGAPRPAILLRPEPRLERRQWAVAHELGEREAATVFRRLSVDPRAAPATAREQIANALAGRILLPTRWIARAGLACRWDLAALKERFETASHELILRRMLDFPVPVVITIFDRGAVTLRRGNIPGRLPLTPIERVCWESVHRSGRTHGRRSARSAVRGWAVHEPDWKRELLRLELFDTSEECGGHEF